MATNSKIAKKALVRTCSDCGSKISAGEKYWETTGQKRRINRGKAPWQRRAGSASTVQCKSCNKKHFPVTGGQDLR